MRGHAESELSAQKVEKDNVENSYCVNPYHPPMSCRIETYGDNLQNPKEMTNRAQAQESFDLQIHTFWTPTVVSLGIIEILKGHGFFLYYLGMNSCRAKRNPIPP